MAFKPAENRSAFLKMGIFGFQGAGKSWTACNVAIGLHQCIKSKKPVGFIDSETGSDFQVERFKKAGVALEVDKSRAFEVLAADMREAEKNYDILIVDSITHFWRELMQAWKLKRHRQFISLRDFGPLKDEWSAGYTLPYINSRMHIIMVGRAANVYEDVEDSGGEEKTKSIKTGTKMSAEGETGFEPSLLVEMERVFQHDGGRYAREATVIKDRFGVLDGKTFIDPDFKVFLPHISLLNLGGEHLGVETAQSSEALFGDGGKSVAVRRQQQQILTEEIEGLLVSAFPGQSVKEKKAKADIVQVAFNTRSWTAICELWPEKLLAGKTIVQYLCFTLAKAQETQETIPEGTDFLPWLIRQWEQQPLAASVVGK